MQDLVEQENSINKSIKQLSGTTSASEAYKLIALIKDDITKIKSCHKNAITESEELDDELLKDRQIQALETHKSNIEEYF